MPNVLSPPMRYCNVDGGPELVDRVCRGETLNESQIQVAQAYLWWLLRNSRGTVNDQKAVNDTRRWFKSYLGKGLRSYQTHTAARVINALIVLCEE